MLQLIYKLIILGDVIHICISDIQMWMLYKLTTSKNEKTIGQKQLVYQSQVILKYDICENVKFGAIQ